LEQEQARLDFSDAELVFGVVCAVGTNYRKVRDALADGLRQFNYEPVEIRLSQHLEILAPAMGPGQYERINGLMNAGNEITKQTGRGGVVALAALSKISASRESGECSCARRPLERRSHILLTLKNPKEVETW